MRKLVLALVLACLRVNSLQAGLQSALTEALIGQGVLTEALVGLEVSPVLTIPLGRERVHTPTTLITFSGVLNPTIPAPLPPISESALSVAKAYEFDLVAKQLDVVDGHELGFFRGVALDDQGSVAYTAVAVDNETQELTGSALIIDNRRIVATGDTIASGMLGFIGEPALAGHGSLAYSADVFVQGAGLSNTGAVVGDRSAPDTHQLLVGRGTTIGGVQLNGAINPTINSLGSLAYTGLYFDTVLGIDAAAIIRDGSVVAATADTVGNFVVDTVDHAALNDQGDLAFAATLIDLTTTESSTAIFINGQLTAFDGAITDGLLLTEVFAPALNQPGDLAYIGRYFDQSAGLENTAIILNGQAVIKSGDITSSGLIIDLIEDVALNTSGQMAFQATFIDPATGAFFEEGVFLARVIPEPSSILLAAFSLIVLLTSRRVPAVK